jgi:hypothetical protein
VTTKRARLFPPVSWAILGLLGGSPRSHSGKWEIFQPVGLPFVQSLHLELHLRGLQKQSGAVAGPKIATSPFKKGHG